MVMRVEEQSVLNAGVDAFILTFDGENPAFRRGADFATGTVANQFRDKFPDAWRVLEAALRDEPGPVKCGRVLAVDLPDGVGPKGLRGVILASTLRHRGDVEGRAMSGIVVSAVRDAVRSARERGWESLASTVMRGGWRLATGDGFQAMVQGYREAARAAGPKVPELVICETHPEPFREITREWDRLLRSGP